MFTNRASVFPPSTTTAASYHSWQLDDDGFNDNECGDGQDEDLGMYQGGASLASHFGQVIMDEDSNALGLEPDDAAATFFLPSHTNNIPPFPIFATPLPPPFPVGFHQPPHPFEPPQTAFPTEASESTPTELLQSLQQELQFPGDGMDEQLTALHPMSNQNHANNPMSLSPENFGVVDFLRHWASVGGRDRDRIHVPHRPRILELAGDSRDKIEYDDLAGDECDLQGINWRALGEGLTRKSARQQRRDTYVNYVNKRGSDKWNPSFPDRSLRRIDDFFRYRRMNLRRDVRLLHFQLRNVFGAASRNRAFYPGYGSVRELDPASGARSRPAMVFEDIGDAQISTLTVAQDILMVGGFYGDYRYRHLDSDDLRPIEGRLTDNIITNHVQIHPSRLSGIPLAAFASNDHGFRMVDLTTNALLSETMYSFPINCSSLSPDGRLRAMVGDCQNLLITDAESGEILQELEGHRDYGFACDWAPNGWTVATGNQDRSIRIWDARKWRNSSGESISVAVIRTEMSGARSLRFSPLGSGKRVLVGAEEADFINIIDAQTFQTKQTIDVFGEIGGTTFTNGGQDLLALSCDRFRGGILQLERCDAGAEDSFDFERRSPRSCPAWQDVGYDWMDSPEDVLATPDSQDTLTYRRRKAALTMGNLDPF